MATENGGAEVEPSKERVYSKDHPRCRFVNRNTNERCKAYCIDGGVVCQAHGGRLPAVKKAAVERKALREMRAFVTPIDPTDPEADPIVGFEVEYRRTISRIRYLNEKITQLYEVDLETGEVGSSGGLAVDVDPHKDPLIYGVIEQKEVEASETPGVDTTYGPGIHVYLQLEQWERHHLLNIEKIWVGAKLGAEKARIEKDKIDLIERALSGVIGRLGLDAKSPEVRAVMREELLQLPVNSTMPSSADLIRSGGKVGKNPVGRPPKAKKGELNTKDARILAMTGRNPTEGAEEFRERQKYVESIGFTTEDKAYERQKALADVEFAEYDENEPESVRNGQKPVKRLNLEDFSYEGDDLVETDENDVEPESDEDF